jgi:hypothetical protein
MIGLRGLIGALLICAAALSTLIVCSGDNEGTVVAKAERANGSVRLLVNTLVLLIVPSHRRLGCTAALFLGRDLTVEREVDR